MGWRSASATAMGRSLIKNAPRPPRGRGGYTHEQYVAALHGYLAALYHLRAEQLPRAYSRSPETEKVQAAVNYAIAGLKARLARATGRPGKYWQEYEHASRRRAPRRNVRGRFTRR